MKNKLWKTCKKLCELRSFPESVTTKPLGQQRGVFWIFAYFFLISAATHMLYSRIALFLKYDLGVAESQIACIDGISCFLASFMRIFSGMLSDCLQNRKLLMLIGCSLIVAARPFIAFASSGLSVFGAVIAERIGNGIQTVPRDALVADLSEENRRGRTFGICRIMKTAGTIPGAVLAYFIIYVSDTNYRLLFVLSAVPAICAMIALTQPTEKLEKPHAAASKNPFKYCHMKSFDRRFFFLMTVAFLGECGHFAESLLTVRAGRLVQANAAGLTSAAAAFGQAVFAYIAGTLADRKDKILLIKICIYLAVGSLLIMAATTSTTYFFIAAAVCCGQETALQVIFLALINEYTDAKSRATAIGVFYAITATAYMITGGICGVFCERFGYAPAFLFSAVTCCSALVFMKFQKNYATPPHEP
jgi:MFS family permease